MNWRPNCLPLQSADVTDVSQHLISSKVSVFEAEYQKRHSGCVSWQCCVICPVANCFSDACISCRGRLAGAQTPVVNLTSSGSSSLSYIPAAAPITKSISKFQLLSKAKDEQHEKINYAENTLEGDRELVPSDKPRTTASPFCFY